MSWTQTDTSFKKLQSKRITTSTGKGIDEEKGASSLELFLPDIKTELIVGTPPGTSTSVLAYTGAIGQTLVVDTSVPGNLTWFASTGYGNTTSANDGSFISESQRLGDWVSDKYDAFGTVSGAGYEVKVYDKDSNLITKADPSDWLFDYQTGILVFNSASTTYGAVSTSGPFRIVGYRYIGSKGIIPAYYGGSGFTTYTLGDLLVGAGSTLIKFPVGTDNYVLTADSSQPSGLRWAVGGAGGGAGLTLNGLTASTQYFVTGTSGSGFNISSFGATHTFNIPIAGTGSTGLVSTLDQSFAGIKTFTNDLVISSSTVSTSTVTGSFTVAGGVGIGGSLFLTSSLPSSLSGVIVNNSVVTSGSWAGSAITGFYGGTGYSSYSKGDILVGLGSTFIKLPVGFDNYVLAADNTTASGLKWVANSGGGGGTGSSVYIGESPPPYFSNAGDLWYNSDNGGLNVYYVDVDTAQWVEINSFFGGVDAPANFGIGITQINGLASSSQFLYASIGGSSVTISSAGNGHTVYIPIAGLAVTGLVSGFAQTFGGIKTFQNGLISGNGVTVYGSLTLPNQPLSAIYGGTGYNSYSKGDILVGAGSTFIKVGSGSTNYILSSSSIYPAGVGWTWVSAVGVGTNPPNDTHDSDLWWNSDDGSLNFYYNDGDTSQWVEIAGGSGIDLSQPVHITSGAASTNTLSGALIVDGGVGVGGVLNATSVRVNGGFDLLDSSLITSTSSANQVGFAVSSADYRTLKFIVSVDSGSDYQSDEILMMHNGSTVFMTEYAQLLSGSGTTITTYDGDISSGNLRLLVSPLNSVTNYSISCIGLRV